ncbi:MAG: hypothetical protein ACOYJY_03295 [Acutalibacteraceae bacterium]|jgi:hypothetical protein
MEQWENGCLTILLSDSELERMGVSFDSLDGARPATRQALRFLLQTAKGRTGLPRGDRVRVEALPTRDGCMLLVTPLTGRRRLRIRRPAQPTVWAIASTDDLLALGAALRRRGTLPPGLIASSLYRAPDGYRLILCAPRAAAWLPRMLSEYARLIDRGDTAAARIAEWETPLVIGHALDALGYRECR